MAADRWILTLLAQETRQIQTDQYSNLARLRVQEIN